jgi:alkanesulfonate monooxygenase SsuD/methylene tetrahydromethanopterin reductase-like flavin-dependent oxidoreductase (luciferase family)
LGEAVTIIKQLFAGGEVTFAGAHYTVARHRLHPSPVQTPRPPLLIAGNSRPLLTLAAHEADIMSFLGFSHTHGGRHFDLAAFTDAGTEGRMAIVREAAAQRFPSLELMRSSNMSSSARGRGALPRSSRPIGRSASKTSSAAPTC